MEAGQVPAAQSPLIALGPRRAVAGAGAADDDSLDIGARRRRSGGLKQMSKRT